jgi:hypothetical protein
MSGTAQQESGARYWLDGAGFVTSEGGVRHVVRRVSTMAEGFCREFTNRVNAPWALRARLAAIPTGTTFRSDHLIIGVSWANIRDTGLHAALLTQRMHTVLPSANWAIERCRRQAPAQVRIAK